MKTVRDLARLSGVLEGEASFYIKKGSPCIALQMSDRDVVEWVAELCDVQPSMFQRKPKGKSTYLPISHCRISGTRAIQWMMTLYVLMGERRKAKMRDVIMAWRGSKASPRASRGARFMATCHPDRPRVGGGLCKNCYMREYRKTHGFHTQKKQRELEQTPGYVSRRKKSMATCHPDQVMRSRGLCAQCYMRAYKAEQKAARTKPDEPMAPPAAEVDS